MVLVLEQFINNLRESRLVPAGEVALLQDAVQASKTPLSVDDIGKLLIQRGKLTQYQLEMINQGQPQSLILGEYVLLNILGKGGMGVVFRARHRRMDRIVALKTLPAGIIKPGAVQRFYREVKAVARLSHPNIVTAYDAGEHGGTHYLVMEYVVGRDLAAIVKEKGPLPLHQAIDYAQQAARGLDFAHRNGVVHRDVKPSNLLVDEAGVVKILDMGLARLNENLVDAPESAELTGAGQILGTVDYMSPEQAEDVRLADHRSDIYSLGCTLHFLLTRRPVYGGETILQRILCHREYPVPSLMGLRPDCPEALDALVQWMLAKRPEDRPQTMAVIIAELDTCRVKPGTVPPPVGMGPEKSNPVDNWLEDLSHESATPSTEGSQEQEITLGSTAGDGIDSRSIRTGAGGSSIRRSKKQLHRAGAKKRTSAAGSRLTWRIIAAGAVTAVIAAVTAIVLMQRPAGRDSAGAKDDSADAKAKASEVSADNPAKPLDSTATASKPDRPIKSPAWKGAWADAKRRADRLVTRWQFADAIRAYSILAGQFKDPQLRQQCNEEIHRIEVQADTSYRAIEADAREHLRQARYSQARAALQAVVTTFGSVPATGRARKLIEDIDQAEKRAAAQAVKPVEPSHVPAGPIIPPELLEQRKRDSTLAKAMEATERRVAAWDFQGAVQELENVRLDSPDLVARLKARREQIGRMADWKARVIAKINQTEPPLQKADLSLRGFNGEIIRADAEAITSTLPNGKEESLAWADLGPKAVPKLLQLVLRSDDSGDLLTAGLLSLVGQDVQSAERYFEKAQSQGAEAASYAALLAARDFALVQDLLGKRKYAEAKARLSAIQEKYGKLPWFVSNKPEFDAAVKDAVRGLREMDAEGVYSQAAGLFRAGDLYELKPVLARLKTQYADTAVATDPRKPSLAEMEKAVAELGPLIRVRKDGTGDARTVQEAVGKAVDRATIQIEESGPWAEQIVVPSDKARLTICGKRGLLPLPVLTTAGAENNYAENILIHAPQVTLERLAIVRGDSTGPLGTALTAEKSSVTLRRVIVHGHVHAGLLDAQQSVCTATVRVRAGAVAKDSVFFGQFGFQLSGSLDNVLVCGGGVICGPDSQVRHCTIVGPLHLLGMSSTVSDSIVALIVAPAEGHKIEHCDVFGVNPSVRPATLGKGCLKILPQFADPPAFDFRLQSGSPCRKVASDGGDLGFTYSPDIQALLKVAADLRNRARGKM